MNNTRRERIPLRNSQRERERERERERGQRTSTRARRELNIMRLVCVIRKIF